MSITQSPEPPTGQAPEYAVLIIDDDDLVRETMADICTFEKMAVVTAVDGEDGIAKLQAHKDRIGVVLLDLSMPGISSEETFAQLRNINPDLPIFLCSGFSELKVSAYFADQNYDGFIAKPFEPNVLLQKIRTYL